MFESEYNLTTALSPEGYYQYPVLFKEHVFFLCEGDIWHGQIKEDGQSLGLHFPPRRLTAGLGSASSLVVCQSGTSLAFVSSQESAGDLYLMPSQGGAIKRLTYIDNPMRVVGYLSERKILIASCHASPFARVQYLYEVDVRTGCVTKQSWGVANFASFGPDGSIFLGRHGYGYPSWKGYRGGTAGQIWVMKGSEAHRLLPTIESNLLRPFYLQGRLFFLSDHEKKGALYSVLPCGSDLKKHTFYDDFYVRHVSTDGHRMIYAKGAALFVFDPVSGKNSHLKININSPRIETNRRFEDPQENFSAHQMSSDGKLIALITRGRLFVGSPFKGAMKQIGQSQGLRYRLVRWRNTEELCVVRDEGLQEQIEIINVNTLVSRKLIGVWGRLITIEMSPDGAFVIASNHAHRLMHIALKNGQITDLEKTACGAYQGISISLDSQWIAYSCAVAHQMYQIRLWNIKAKKSHALAKPVLGDTFPVFEPTGRFLYFLSRRTAAGEEDAVFVFVCGLSGRSTSPFRIPDPLPEENKEQKRKLSADTSKMTVDLTGISQRIWRFPLSESVISGLWATAERVYFLKKERPSVIAPAQHSVPQGFSLVVFDMQQLKADVLATNVLDLSFSIDGEWLTLVYADKRLRTFRDGEKLEEEDRSFKDGGFFDWARLSLEVKPLPEWSFMFQEAWRLQKDLFWDQKMGGVNWESIRERYATLLPRVSTPAELMDVITEMQGELRVGHAYSWGFDQGEGPQYKIGRLGAIFQADAKTGTAVFKAFLPGDERFEPLRSPLLSCGHTFHDGDKILSVDGQMVTKESPLAAMLVDRANRDVSLGVCPKGKRKPVFLTVKPLRSERPLYYTAFVEKNAAYVQKKSKGRLGYIHVPDMSTQGYEAFYRAYAHEFNKDALIIDVRFNGGGNISSELLSQLMRKRLGFDQSRHEGRIPYMDGSPKGPMVALCNEYTGSDGDMFAYAFQKLKLGPLIGKRTWGGVIGIWPKHPLLDGSWTSQPSYAIWFHDIGWTLENKGAQPDIDIDNTPKDEMQGKDPQLERGITEALKQIDKAAVHPTPQSPPTVV